VGTCDYTVNVRYDTYTAKVICAKTLLVFFKTTLLEEGSGSGLIISGLLLSIVKLYTVS